jgi:hypothetical protein
VSTFVEDTTKTNGTLHPRGLVEGQYLGHIVNARDSIHPVKDRFKARIYNYDVMVADEHAKRTHQYEDITGKHVEISGEQFVGRKLIAKGIFKFLDPQEGDDFEGNPTDNKKYSLFCETLGLVPTEETRTIDGTETLVKILPLLTIEHMVGRPVTAHLVKVKDEWINKKTGEKMDYSWRVSYCTPWTLGTVKKMTVDDNDLPF